MIQSIADKTTQHIYDGINSRHARKIPKELHGKTRRLLDQIQAAPSLDFLKTPPSNDLKKLEGKSNKYWRLKINDQWRIIFQWIDNNAHHVQVIDYH